MTRQLFFSYDRQIIILSSLTSKETNQGRVVPLGQVPADANRVELSHCAQEHLELGQAHSMCEPEKTQNRNFSKVNLTSLYQELLKKTWLDYFTGCTWLHAHGDKKMVPVGIADMWLSIEL